MGVRYPTVSTTTVLGVSISGAGESVMCTTLPLNIPLDFAQVILLWYCLWLTNTTGTTVAWRLRRGTTTAATLINVSNTLPTGAAIQMAHSGIYVDTPGAVAGQQYSLSCLLAGGGGNAGGLDVAMIAFAL